MTSNAINQKQKISAQDCPYLILEQTHIAYLRQDKSLMSASLPSSTVIDDTAGPENLAATQTGLLHLLVKEEDKGNMHQLMLENALVVPGW